MLEIFDDRKKVPGRAPRSPRTFAYADILPRVSKAEKGFLLGNAGAEQ
jgi:hypothetical protein